MLFSQLDYFVALAEHRHFGRAASASHVSQSAFSEAIRKLEGELDVPLVQRGKNFEGLTPEGERLVVWARQILQDKQGLRDEVLSMRSTLTGTLRLGIIPSATTVASRLVDAYCREHPLVHVRTSSDLPSHEIIRRLRDFRLDAGIIYPSSEDTSGLILTPLVEERQRVIMSAPLSAGRAGRAGAITGAELAELPLCLLHQGMRARQLLDSACADRGITLGPRVETDSVEGLHAQVRSGDWAAVIPAGDDEPSESADGIRSFELIDPEVRAPVALATGAGDVVSVLVRRLNQSARTASLAPGSAAQAGSAAR